MTTRVLIADDHPVFREGLRFTLERAPDIVVAGEAGDRRGRPRVGGRAAIPT